MRLHWREFPSLARAFFEKEFGVLLQSEVKVVLSDGQTHRFDLGSNDRSVLIECKSYTFTASGNEPAAKLNHARTDGVLLRSSTARHKVLVFDDDVIPAKGSLAQLYERRNRAWLADVQVWRHWQGAFSRVTVSRSPESVDL